MAKPLRWGILSTGNIARQFAEGMVDSRTGVAAAVASRIKSQAEVFAAKYHIGRAHGGYQSLLEDPEIDAVYNALPNSMHYEWTLKALRAGKHVLCEKPFSVTVAEAQEMFDLASAKGLILIEAFMYRAHPLTRAVSQEIADGTIGEVRLIRTSFVFRTRQTEGNIRFSTELAGGSLMDIGCYCVNFSRLHAAAEPTEIHAVGHLHESGVDDWAAGMLKFPNGVLATFTCGMSAQADNTASICGSDGYIETAVPWKPPVHGASYVVGHSTPPKMDRAGGAPAPPPKQTKCVDADQALYAIEADAFAAAVTGDAAPFVSEQDTLSNVRILQEMRRQLGIIF